MKFVSPTHCLTFSAIAIGSILTRPVAQWVPQEVELKLTPENCNVPNRFG